MIVKRDPDRFKKLYPDKKAVIPKDYNPDTNEYEIFSSVGRFKIINKERHNEKEPSSKS